MKEVPEIVSVTTAQEPAYEQRLAVSIEINRISAIVEVMENMGGMERLRTLRYLASLYGFGYRSFW